MSKKKKADIKIKKKISKKDLKRLEKMDKQVNKDYKKLIGEVRLIKEDLYNVDKAAKKKAMKKAKGDKKLYKKYYKEDKKRLMKRMEVIEEMESFDLATNLDNSLNNISYCVVLFSKLVMSIIVTILSIDSVKYNASEETLEKMQSIYAVARNIAKN